MKEGKMNKISYFTSCFCFIPTVIMADPNVSSPAPRQSQLCPCPQAFQGFYVGGSFGYGIGSVSLKGVAPTQTLKDKIGVQGFDGGLLLGYTYVFTNKVGLGLDAYFNWASTQGTTSATDPSVAVGNLRKTISLQNAFQLRVPLSYVINSLVAPKIYVGWDNSRWNTYENFGLGRITASNKSRYNGILWGVGTDFLLAKHIISGLEYTGVFYQSRAFGPHEQNAVLSSSTRPVYNTFKATLKFIY